jgi:hypothetical protein
VSEIVLKLPERPNFRAMQGATDEIIKQAEQKLGLQFSDEFREYLIAFGVASVYGHELTGICDFPRLNVVDVTFAERASNPNIKADWCVIEQANIDGIVIWQSITGEVYQTMPGSAPIKLCDSLSGYIDL